MTNKISSTYLNSFKGITSLYGICANEIFYTSKVMVIGIGGVGSWAVEALARTGIGNLVIVDLDDVCITNINRQLCALHSTIGNSKISVMKERILDINLECNIDLVDSFIDENNIDFILKKYNPDFIIDAIDNAKVKAALINYCRINKYPLICIGASGGKIDPTKIKIGDISRTIQDPLLKSTRNILNKQYGYKERYKNKKYSVNVIYSSEHIKREVVVCNLGKSRCEGFGSITTVTASFANFAVYKALDFLLSRNK